MKEMKQPTNPGIDAKDKVNDLSDPEDMIDHGKDEATEYEPHQVHSAAKTLIDAEEVKGKPKLHNLAKKHLAMQGHHISKITSMDQLKAVAKFKIKKDAGGNL